MIITFSTTAKLAQAYGKPDPLIYGVKTVTRRLWSDRTANSWIKYWGKVHKAYDKAPYTKGRQIGWVKLTEPPYQEKLADMPEGDLIKEGDLWDSKEDYFKCINCDGSEIVWVARFQFELLQNQGEK